MSHWNHGPSHSTDPRMAPPTPRSATSNDIGARVARLEEHANFAAYHRQEIHEHSLRRDRDITDQSEADSKRIDEIEAHQDNLLQTIEVWRRSSLIVLAGARYSVVVVAIAMWISGQFEITATDLKWLYDRLGSLMS